MTQYDRARSALGAKLLQVKLLARGVRSCIRFINAVSFLLFPSNCLLCGLEDEVLCRRCFACLKYRYCTKSVEGSCDVLLRGDGTSRVKVFAGARYAQTMKNFSGTESGFVNNTPVISSYKKYGAPVLKRYLAEVLAENLTAVLSQIKKEGDEESAEVRKILLVPVPDSLKAFVKRGFSPVSDILKSAHFEKRCSVLCDKFDVGIEPADLLRLTIKGNVFHVSQKNLAARQRISNRRGTMRLSFLGKLRLRRQCLSSGRTHYVIVDDVLTTGATLNEAYRALSRGLSLVSDKVYGKTKKLGAKDFSCRYGADCNSAIAVASTGY